MSLRIFLHISLLLTMLWGCQGPAPTEMEEIDSAFEWTDPSTAFAYPGPYAEGDSLLGEQALDFLDGFAQGDLSSFPYPIADSIKVSLLDEPVFVILGKDFKSYLQGFHHRFLKVEYEAFNVQTAYNISFKTHISFCFGRWQYTTKDGNLDDRYGTFVLVLDSLGRMNTLSEWGACWPTNSPIPFHPNSDPRSFHFYSPTKLGTQKTAVMAVNAVQSLHARDSVRSHSDMADSVLLTTSCGLNQHLSKFDIGRISYHYEPFIGVYPISVIPFYMKRQKEEIVHVMDYESFVEDGAVRRYSYFRTFIFDASHKIRTILVQRRLVPNSVDWTWQRAPIKP